MLQESFGRAGGSRLEPAERGKGPSLLDDNGELCGHEHRL